MTQPADNPPVTISPERLERMRREVKRRLEEARSRRRLVCPWPPPRYDRVFVEGTAWLDANG